MSIVIPSVVTVDQCTHTTLLSPPQSRSFVCTSPLQQCCMLMTRYKSSSTSSNKNSTWNQRTRVHKVWIFVRGRRQQTTNIEHAYLIPMFTSIKSTRLWYSTFIDKTFLNNFWTRLGGCVALAGEWALCCGKKWMMRLSVLPNYGHKVVTGISNR